MKDFLCFSFHSAKEDTAQNTHIKPIYQIFINTQILGLFYASLDDMILEKLVPSMSYFFLNCMFLCDKVVNEMWTDISWI